jgi:hypothetical protein
MEGIERRRPEIGEDKQKQLQVVAAMWRAGVKIAGALTGSFRGWPSVAPRAGVARAIGAVRWRPFRRPRQPAEFMGKPSYGSIEAGKAADLLIWTLNLLGDIANTQRISLCCLAASSSMEL